MHPVIVEWADLLTGPTSFKASSSGFLLFFSVCFCFSMHVCICCVYLIWYQDKLLVLKNITEMTSFDDEFDMKP